MDFTLLLLILDLAATACRATDTVSDPSNDNANISDIASDTATEGDGGDVNLISQQGKNGKSWNVSSITNKVLIVVRSRGDRPEEVVYACISPISQLSTECLYSSQSKWARLWTMPI